MAATHQISILEYRQTSYRPDREYVDGELRERNVGKYEHARTQLLLASWFRSQEKTWQVKGVTEQRLQVSPTRVRIPDLALLSRGPHPEILTDPPILVVEILSPEDTYSEMQRRAADYLQMGVGSVWIIDPATRTGRSCVGSTWTEEVTLRHPGTAISVDLHQLFAELVED